MNIIARIINTLLCLALAYAVGFAQKRVSGTVIDENGESMPGATVLQKGTQIAVATDLQGHFTIMLQGEKPVLVAQYIGYKPVEKTVTPDVSTVNFQLFPEANVMDEVVVVGYGKQKKINLTGAVDQVTGEVFDGRPTANIAQMLEGVIPNLNIDINDGRPSTTANFNVRGTGSINGGNALVLIDGVEGAPSSLNPDDIESVTVLKDAASSAIYGARAPYGVVLITTKNPDKGKTKVSYSSNYTWAEPLNVPDIVQDGYTWAEMAYTNYFNRIGSVPSTINGTFQFSLPWLQEYKQRKEDGNFGTVISDGSIGTKNRYVYYNEGRDIYGELYKNNVFSTTQNLSISGSNNKFDYYLSGRFYHYDGLFNSPDNSDKMDTYQMRFKAGYQFTNWLKISNNMSFSHQRHYVPKLYGPSTSNIWVMINVKAFPAEPMFNPDGTMTDGGMYSVAQFLYGNSGQTNITERFRNTTSFTADIWKDHLALNGDFTLKRDRSDVLTRNVMQPYSTGVNSNGEAIMKTLSGTQSELTQKMGHTDYLATNIYANFNYNFNKIHQVGLTAGWNYEKYSSKVLSATNDELLTPDVENLQLAMGTDNKSITSSWGAYQFGGLFFRANYSFDNRYLLEINGRYDGSSRFPQNNRWAFFPSASLGWRIDQEKFWNVSPAAVSNLKVRASYGKLGNALGLSNYQYKQTFAPSKSTMLLDGVINRYVKSPAALPGDLTWESAATIDVGGDIAFLNNRLNITGDWYHRKTTDMIVSGPTVPDVFGASSPKGNYAKLSTYGYEISVEYRDKFKLAGKNFNWSIRATLADYYSVIDEYNNATMSLSKYARQDSKGRADSDGSNYYKGMRIGEIWGFLTDGLYQTQDQIDADLAKANAAGQSYYNPMMQNNSKYIQYPGDIRFRDLNNNGYIDRGSNTVDDPGDRTIIGNEEPRYIYSFSLSADWNGFWASAMFQGIGKRDWYPSTGTPLFWGQYQIWYANVPAWHVGNYWTEDNPDAYLPRYSSAYPAFKNGDQFANDRYLQNASYLRLKNLQFGYNLPSKLTRKVKLEKVGFFFSGENLYTWSPLYKRSKDINVVNIGNGDTENGGTQDGANYPSMRSFSFGINITY